MALGAMEHDRKLGDLFRFASRIALAGQEHCMNWMVMPRLASPPTEAEQEFYGDHAQACPAELPWVL